MSTPREFIDIQYEGAVAVMRLNRPDNLNSWNQQMRDEMRTAVADLVADDALRVLVITGTGRAFSAGEDVRGMKGLTDIGTRGFRRVARDIHNVFDEIEAIEVPVIAAINGVAAGGGMELALSCDFRFASDAARMGFPENNVGLIPGSGGCSRLVRQVGLSAAKRIVMTGEMLNAEKALALRLVDEVVPAAQLMEQVMAFARTLAARAPQALGLAKVVLNNCARVDPDVARNFERLGQSILKKTDDHLEGARAFVEKRPAQFTGR
ncbi:MAG: enoyl-CoA hydratase/isomerase family protein [Betaproteobacteria bacterium]|jgi:enoyl-CoA hydratase/carnithine racemase|nr:enoyl-CoA hydratase/isomerase family protein [Betaproteobacteria bacterium]NBS47009.1 enoyl-CoA hydratase/isomerase family protein [Betaproteobacteria bacterium]